MIDIPPLRDWVENGCGLVVHGWDRISYPNEKTGRTVLVNRCKEVWIEEPDFPEGERPVPEVRAGGAKVSYKEEKHGTAGDMLLVPQDIL